MAPDLTGQRVLIAGRQVQGVQHLVLYDQQDRRVAAEPGPGAGPKLLALASELGAVHALCIYDQRKDDP